MTCRLPPGGTSAKGKHAPHSVGARDRESRTWPVASGLVAASSAALIGAHLVHGVAAAAAAAVTAVGRRDKPPSTSPPRRRSLSLICVRSEVMHARAVGLYQAMPISWTSTMYSTPTLLALIFCLLLMRGSSTH